MTMNKIFLSCTFIFGFSTGCSQLPPHDGSMKAVYGVQAQSGDIKSRHKGKHTRTASTAEGGLPLIKTVSSGTSSRISIDSINHASDNASIARSTADTSIEHYYVLESDDTLYSVAAELTDSGFNWKEIAKYNNISSPGAISVGTEIIIPEHLLIDRLKTTHKTPELKQQTASPSLVAKQWKTTATVSASTQIIEKKEEPSIHAEAKMDTPSATEKIKSKAASLVKSKLFSEKEDKNKETLSEQASSQKQNNKEISQGQRVLVSGSFTPKAVYKGAGYNSGLLMRVKPGSKFVLTKTSGRWFQVETNKGAGYIFHRDAQLIQ